LKFTWTDGTSDIILLVEHWSDRSKICLRRALRYFAELLLRHPKHRVYPVMFVTDPSYKEISSKLSYEVAGRTVLSLEFEVVCLSLEQKNAIAESRNLVSAIFWVLVPGEPAPHRAMSALRMIAGWNPDFDDREWVWIVAHIEHLLRTKNKWKPLTPIFSELKTVKLSL